MGYLDSLPLCCLQQPSGLPIPNCSHLFWARSSSFPALLWICSLLTSALWIGPLCDLCDCFSTLFTATNHNIIKGIKGTLTLFQTLPSLTTAMPNVYRMMMSCAQKEKSKINQNTQKITQNNNLALTDAFFQRRTVGIKWNCAELFSLRISWPKTWPGSKMWVQLEMLQRLSGSASVRKHTDICQAFSNSRQQHLWSIKPIKLHVAQSCMWLVCIG